MVKKKRKKRKGVVSAYNRHVGREMRAGKTMKQAAASWKGKGSKRKAPVRRASKPKRRTTTLRRRTRRVGRKGGFNTQKVFKLVRLAALAMPAAVSIMSATSGEEKAKQIMHKYTGVNPTDGTFRLSKLMEGWMPYLAATAVTYGIPKLTGMLRSL